MYPHAYSVDAALSSDTSHSEFEISCGTLPKNVFTVRRIIEGILDDMARHPVRKTELDQSKNILLNQLILTRTSYEGIAGELMDSAMLGLPLDQPETAAVAYSRITVQQVQSAFSRWVRPNDLVQVTRGPRSR